MPIHTNKGGRIPPDGRQPQAKGVGKNAKRHDLERPATPGLHGSDLQKGDVQALEQGQRVAPPTTQERGQSPAPAQQQGGQPAPEGRELEIPDAIDFLGERAQGLEPPENNRDIDMSSFHAWMPILRQMASGPGASSNLVNAFISQARLMRQQGGSPATIVDMNAADDGIEAMLGELPQ